MLCLSYTYLLFDTGIVERQKLLPCSQQVLSISCGSRRRDATDLKGFSFRTSCKRRLDSSSREPLQGKTLTVERKQAM